MRGDGAGPQSHLSRRQRRWTSGIARNAKPDVTTRDAHHSDRDYRDGVPTTRPLPWPQLLNPPRDRSRRAARSAAVARPLPHPWPNGADPQVRFRCQHGRPRSQRAICLRPRPPRVPGPAPVSASARAPEPVPPPRRGRRPGVGGPRSRAVSGTQITPRCAPLTVQGDGSASHTGAPLDRFGSHRSTSPSRRRSPVFHVKHRCTVTAAMVRIPPATRGGFT